MPRTTRSSPMAGSAKPNWSSACWRSMGELIAAHRPDLVVVACNTASTLVLPQLRATIPSAVRRHRAGDQAGLRRLEDQARFGARHRGHGAARIHPRADPRFRRRLRHHIWSARRGSPNSPRRSCTAQPLADADIAARDRAMLRRAERRAHRHDRAGLHPLPAAAGPAAAPGALAGGISSIRRRRSRGGWSICWARRPAPARADHPASSSPRAARLRPLSEGRFGGLWHRRNRPCRRLTCPPFPPKNRPSRGPFGPRGVSRPAVCAGASAASLSVPAMPGQRRARSSNLNANMRTR